MNREKDREHGRRRGLGGDDAAWKATNQAAADKSSQSVVWISLYNYLVTRNNGVEPGNMPKTFNEPDAPSCGCHECHMCVWVCVGVSVCVCVAAGS